MTAREPIEPAGAAPPLQLRAVSKSFAHDARFFTARRGGAQVRAVDSVDLVVGEREVLGIVGESGAGKSTLGELMVGLQHPSSGRIEWHGSDIHHLSREARRRFHREVQMVFQDPFGSLDQNFTTYQSVVEPAVIAGIRNRADRLARVRLALQRSGLDSTDTLLRSYPHGLSGGQRQRIAIARAIVMEPRILIADEPVSMLDASVRSGILNLFKQLRDELGLSIVYVSHDLPSVHYLCDRVVIMFAGRVVEVGPARDIIELAHHPYTRELLGAVPGAETSDDSAEPVPEKSEITDVDACRFAGRCRYVQPDCVDGEPAIAAVTDRHQVRCLHPRTAPMWKSSV